MKRNDCSTDRALSSAVTHVLTMGITTILIAMLLMSTGTMLETYSDQSAEQALETVGERVAGEVERADRLGSEDGEVNVTADHPQTVAGSAYTVELLEDSSCEESPFLEDDHSCVRLTASSANAEVYVPFTAETAIDEGSSATGGTIEIEHDGEEISLR